MKRDPMADEQIKTARGDEESPDSDVFATPGAGSSSYALDGQTFVAPGGKSYRAVKVDHDAMARDDVSVPGIEELARNIDAAGGKPNAVYVNPEWLEVCPELVEHVTFEPDED